MDELTTNLLLHPIQPPLVVGPLFVHDLDGRPDQSAQRMACRLRKSGVAGPELVEFAVEVVEFPVETAAQLGELVVDTQGQGVEFVERGGGLGIHPPPRSVLWMGGMDGWEEGRGRKGCLLDDE